MADGLNPLTSMSAKYAVIIQSVITIVEVVIILILIGFAFWYVARLKKYNVAVRIKSVREGSDGSVTHKMIYDKGAYLLDKVSRSEIFRLLKTKKAGGKPVDIEPPPLRYLRPMSKAFTTNEVTLLQVGLDELYPIAEVDTRWIPCPKCKGVKEKK